MFTMVRLVHIPTVCVLIYQHNSRKYRVYNDCRSSLVWKLLIIFCRLAELCIDFELQNPSFVYYI